MLQKADGEKPVANFDDAESLGKALVEFGVSDSASRQLCELSRYSLHLLATKDRAGAKQGFSKIGGIPDLPEGTSWPVRPSFPVSEDRPPNGFLEKLLARLFYRKPGEREVKYRKEPQPYNFIAQISFQEMASKGVKDLQLPRTGALYLFYDDLLACWGFDPKDAIGFKVIYVEGTDGTTEAERPEFFEEVPTYKEVHVEPVLHFEHTRPEGMHFESLSLSEADEEAYIEFDEQVEHHRFTGPPVLPAHKVRGWSNNIQNPMEEQCALVSSGIDCGASGAYSSPEAKRVLDEPNDWVQLLQIDSDEQTGMMWGDTGMLYLWIKKSDLEKRSFDNTWLILQCS